MSDKPTRGRRVNIYLPADLLERWEATPRYERSAVIAAALRRHWGDMHTDSHTPGVDQCDTGEDTLGAEGIGKR